MNSIKLINYSFYHALLVLLPMILGGLIAIKKNETNTLVILAAAAVSGGLFSYGIFWLFLISSVVGIWASYIGYLVIVILIVTWLRREIFTKTALLFANPICVWVCYSIFILAIGFFPSDLKDPMNFAAIRFSHLLPGDNQLPYMFAEQILNGKILSPMTGDWLSSDRPPLQTAYFLASGIDAFTYRAWHYQVLATFLQCLWVIPMWMLLLEFKIKKVPFVLALTIPMYSGFALVHSIYTWPKLFPVFYLVLIFGIIFDENYNLKNKFVCGIFVGILAALAMLCHGGTIFLLSGFGLSLLIIGKTPSKSFSLAAIVSGIILLGTWSYYQNVIDPPGNRLLKWHLAGIVPIDPRSVGQALWESYRALTINEIYTYKVSNLLAIFGEPIILIKNTLKVFFDDSRKETISAVRSAQFFNIWAACGFFSFSLFALLAGRYLPFSVEKKIGYRFLYVSVVSIFIWSMLMFGPGSTAIHQGSLAVLIFLLSGLVLFSCSVNKYLAYLLSALNFTLVFVVYIYVPADFLNIQLMILAALSFAASSSILLNFKMDN